MRGAFARSSSAASGFFFCGMIDEDDAQASETSQNPNSSDDHSTISAPSRDRWVAHVEAAERKSKTKSRFETASIEFGTTPPAKPSSEATSSRSVGKFTPASAPAPKGSSAVDASTTSNRARSRWNIQKYASRWCERYTG